MHVTSLLDLIAPAYARVVCIVVYSNFNKTEIPHTQAKYRVCYASWKSYVSGWNGWLAHDSLLNLALREVSEFLLLRTSNHSIRIHERTTLWYVRLYWTSWHLDMVSRRLYIGLLDQRLLLSVDLFWEYNTVMYVNTSSADD